MRTAFAVVLSWAVALPALVTRPVAQDLAEPAQILAAMRQALGGEAALNAVHSWSVGGSQTTRQATHDASFSIEMFCEFPDKFAWVSTQFSPVGRIANTIGFNGNDLVRQVDTDLPVPPDPEFLPPNPTTADRIRARQVRVADQKRRFLRFALAMFGQSAAAYPVQFRSAGSSKVNGANAAIVEASDLEGNVWQLLVEERSHLPLMLAWLEAEPPSLVASSSRIVTVPRGASLPSDSLIGLPASPPAIQGVVPTAAELSGRPKLRHELSFSEFRSADGLNWPHRLKVMVGGRLRDDIRLGRFRINPKIGPRVFSPAR